MQKIFIVTGELSGDKTAAWYLKRLFQFKKDIYCQAVGGDCLQNAGADIYKRFEKLNVTGFVEIASKLFFILNFLKNLADYIIKNNFDHVVFVDFPGFNLKLAKILKKKNPKIKITYLSPPQLWIWGAWRLKKLKKLCDELIVLYPFEVEWYKERGIEAKFLGNPLCDNLKDYLGNDLDRTLIKNQIAFLPASRESELKRLLPFFAQLLKRFLFLYPNIKFVLPLAQSLNLQHVENMLEQFDVKNNVKIVQGEENKLKALSQSCLAISKPGTVSLELALLKIPAVIFYKASWLTYYLAKLLVKIEYMSLPNLFLNREVYPEFIQNDCSVDKVFNSANKIYKSFLDKDFSYWQKREELRQVEKMLCKKKV